MTVREPLAELQILPRDLKILAFEADSGRPYPGPPGPVSDKGELVKVDRWPDALTAGDDRS